MKIKEIFVSSNELKNLKASLDNIAAIQYTDTGISEKMKDMYPKLRAFCNKIVEEKSKSSDATAKENWAKKNKDKNVYAYVCATKTLSGESHFPLDAVNFMKDCHKLYKMSDTITRFPWKRVRDAGAISLANYLIVSVISKIKIKYPENSIKDEKALTSAVKKEIPNIQSDIKSFMKKCNNYEEMDKLLGNYTENLVGKICKKLKWQ